MKTLLLVTFIFTFFFTAQAPATTTLQAELVSTSTSITSFSDHDEGLFKIQVKLTAIGGDAYLVPSLLGPSDEGFLVSIRRNGFPSGSPAQVVAINLTSATNEILDGESETFEIVTSVTPNLSGLYSVQLAEINWSEGAINPGYSTSYVFLNGSSAPEPSRILFLGFGLATVAFCRRR
jgi:hypothetical protein